MPFSGRLLIIQPDCRAYRVPFFRELAHQAGSFELLHFGASMFHEDERIHELGAPLLQIGSFRWIRGLHRLVQSYDLVVFMNDIHWLNAFMLPFRHPGKCLAWGHGPGRSAWVNRLRKRQIPHVPAFIVYGDEGRRALMVAGAPSEKVFVAPNTIDVPNARDTSADPKDCFLYVGRIQERKKLGILLDAFAQVAHALPEIHVRIVGDGAPEKEVLLAKTEALGLQNRVHFFSGTDDPEMLAAHFSRAMAYVSPGPVGLGVLHSFAYGVPVITLNGMHHGPEFSHLTDKCNGRILADAVMLPEALLEASNPETVHLRGSAAFARYQTHGTMAGMVAGFMDALRFASADSR